MRRLWTALAAVAVVSALAAWAVFDEIIENELSDMPHATLGETCGPKVDDCRRFAATKFGSPPPVLPNHESFDHGEESGSLLMLQYGELRYVVARRSPDRLETPVDDAAYTTTPAGRRVVAARETRIDFWDDRFHYAVTGSPRDALTALIDAAA